MLGNEAEFLLRSLGFEDLRATFDSKQLVPTATQINPQRLESVAGTLNKFRGWAFYQSSLIIERVYGLDYLSDIGAKDRKSTRLNSSHRNTSRMPSSA